PPPCSTLFPYTTLFRSLIGNRTAVINQIRGFLLEHGIPVRQGHHFLRKQLPLILATRTDVLSPRMIRIIGDLMADWKYLDERIRSEEHTSELQSPCNLV